MRRFWGLCVMWPGAALADGWTPVTGSEIAALLNDAEVTYADASQTFDPRGFTTYTDHRLSEGRWRVTGDQYCSLWPPSDRWVCYDVTVNDHQIRFIGPDQSVSEGVLTE